MNKKEMDSRGFLGLLGEVVADAIKENELAELGLPEIGENIDDILAENNFIDILNENEIRMIKKYAVTREIEADFKEEDRLQLNDKMLKHCKGMTEKQLSLFMLYTFENIKTWGIFDNTSNNDFFEALELQKTAQEKINDYGIKKFILNCFAQEKEELALLQQLEEQRNKDKGSCVTLKTYDTNAEEKQLVTTLLSQTLVFYDFNLKDLYDITTNLDNVLKEYNENILELSEEIQIDILTKYSDIITKAIYNSERDGEPVENLNPKLPPKLIIANHKIVNQMGDFKKTIEESEGSFLTEAKVPGEKKESIVITTCALECNNIEDAEIRSTRPFTPYDRSVFNAVVSLYERDNTCFTPAMVYRTMTNAANGQFVSPQCKGAVAKSLDKMRATDIYINGVDELKARNKDFSIQYEGYLLPLEKVTVKTGGHIKKAYKILSEPCLYSYSKTFKQVIQVPNDVLDIYVTDKGLIQCDSNGNALKEDNRGNRIIIKNYLIMQIEWIRKNRNPVINLDTLYSELLEKRTEKIERTAREYAEICLKSWVATGYIKAYKMQKVGKEFTGIKVTV